MSNEALRLAEILEGGSPQFNHEAAALLRQLSAERDQLRAEVERLRADAERYRILRQQHEEADSGLTLCVFHPVNDSTLEPVGSMPGELDTAIDRARTTHKDPA